MPATCSVCAVGVGYYLDNRMYTCTYMYVHINYISTVIVIMDTPFTYTALQLAVLAVYCIKQVC